MRCNKINLFHCDEDKAIEGSKNKTHFGHFEHFEELQLVLCGSECQNGISV
jgi:hypothetical protein